MGRANLTIVASDSTSQGLLGEAPHNQGPDGRRFKRLGNERGIKHEVF